MCFVCADNVTAVCSISICLALNHVLTTVCQLRCSELLFKDANKS